MTAPPIPSEHFRPDVEGLRAVAVVLVLLYHADLPNLGGGFVGVDVFFVISGFLITGLLLRELDATGRVSFSGFYARRARRLLPASALTLLAILVASVVLLPPIRIQDVAKDIASAAAYVSNLRFGIAANDYFQTNAAPSPVLHFWSLSVEEQYYLFWPAVMFILFQFSERLRIGRRGLFLGVAALSSASLVACMWLTVQDQPWAFYLLPTRAWELGLGALLAISAEGLPLPGRRTATLLVTAGLIAIAAAAFLFTENTLFPGSAAILPAAGAGLVILGGMRPGSLPSRILSTPPCTFLGRISYSVYLWHWPLLVFAGVLYGAALPLPLAVLVASASIPVATITQRLVEQPFRLGRVIGLRSRVNLVQALISSLTIAGAAAAAGMYVVVGNAQLANLIPHLDDLKRHTSGWCLDVTHLDDGWQCVSGDANSATTAVLFGDSVAEQWYPALAGLADNRRWRLISLTRPGCSWAAIRYVNRQLNRVETECEVWRNHALERITQEAPVIVVVSNTAHPTLIVNGVETSDPAKVLNGYGAGIEATLVQLTTNVLVIGSTPVAPFDVPTCISAHPSSLSDCAFPSSRAPIEWNALAARIATERGATFLDPTSWICDHQRCAAVIGRFIVYRDQVHLAEPFVVSLEEQLAPSMDKAASQTEARSSAQPLSVTILGTSGLRSYWRLGESSGTTAVDERGVNSGKYINAPTLGVEGAIAVDTNTAVAFNGSTQYVSAGGSGVFTGTNPFTIEAWVQSGTGSGAGTVFWALTDAGAAYLSVQPSYTGVFRYATDNDWALGPPLTPGWHQLVGTYDGTTLRCYFDGRVAGSEASSLGLGSSGTGVGIAARNDGTVAFDGAVDEVAIYDRALSAAEIAAHYSGRIGSP